MHPILNNRRRLQFYLAAWLPIAGFIASLLVRGGTLSGLEATVIAYPIAVEYAFVCLASWYICRVTPLTDLNAWRVLATFGMAAVLNSLIWILTARLWVALLDAFSVFPGLGDRYSGQADGLFLFGILLFLLAAAIHYVFLTVERSREVEKRALEYQVLAREAELKALRAQIDPHFLFNSLNSISALTTGDPSGARRMCVLLGDFLRRSLQLGGRDRITLQDELKLAEGFLDIEKVRFGDRMSFETDVDSEALGCMVPPLLIQPLIENAVRHGVAPLIEGGLVRVSAHRRGGMLEIVVDNPVGSDVAQHEGAGLGLNNVRERLKNVFGDQSAVTVEQQNGRFRVVLRAPCVS